MSNFFGLFQVFWQGLQISFKTQILEIRKCYTTLILSKIRIYFKAPIHLRNASKIHLNVASKSVFKIEIQTIWHYFGFMTNFKIFHHLKISWKTKFKWSFQTCPSEQKAIWHHFCHKNSWIITKFFTIQETSRKLI